MLLDELGTYLQAQGVGTLGQSLFKGLMPLDTPATTADAIVALLEVPGESVVSAHDGAKYEQPHVQVVSRGVAYGYAAAREKAHDAWMALDGLANQVLSGTKYLKVIALQSPFFLRVDAEHRPHIVFSIRIQREI